MSFHKDDEEVARSLLPQALGPAGRHYGISMLATHPQLHAGPVSTAAWINKA
jgi:hypothetical protein